MAPHSSDKVPRLSALRLGPVHLTVTDLGRALEFYRGVLGLALGDESRATVTLSAPEGGHDLVRLTEARDLRAPPSGPGLFHFAMLVPSRRELARTLVGLERRGWPLHGASDHGVSEALYLADPDGHGIEIYADRPPATWRRTDRELKMVTEPLDLRGLLAELDVAEATWTGLPPGTVMGHVHLRVSDLDEAERTFAGTLGLEVTVRDYPGARFFAAGGYHHHVGTNVWWRSRSGPEAFAAARVGLVEFELLVPAGAIPGYQAEPTWRIRAPDDRYDVVVRQSEG